MATLKNDRLLRALMREPVDVTPVWMMRQAGRYLPEYKRIRSEAGGFLNLCKNSEQACEVTLQPLCRYPLDAAILFSDILTIPDAMGLGLDFDSGLGPRFKHTIRSEADVNALPSLDVRLDLDYVLSAVSTIRKELNGSVPLIGFSGSPWTLACYMIEGGSSKDFRHIKTMMYNKPALMHLLLEKLTEVIIDYLNAQILSGVQAVQIFDTWGGCLSHSAYPLFSLSYMKKIINGLIREHEGRKVPLILFTKGSGTWLEDMADVGADCLGLDWSVDIAKARERVGKRVSLQGNLDPSILYASPKVIRREVKSILQSYGTGPGHVFNLGHGIHQFVDPENAKVFIEAVHEFSAEYHRFEIKDRVC